MLTIILQVLKEQKWALLIYSLVVVGFIWVYTALFPVMQGSIEQMSDLLKAMPESLTKGMNFDPSLLSSFEGFIGNEKFSIFWIIISAIFVISMSTNFIANEIETGTAEFLLSQPVSRLKIFLGRFFGGSFCLLIFCLISFLSIFPLTAMYDISIHSDRFLHIIPISFLFVLSVFALSMLFSAIFSEVRKVSFCTSGVLLIMYVLHISSNLKESLSGLKYYSFFYYFNLNDILINNKINSFTWWVLGGTCVLCVTIGAFCFHKRDIAV